MSINQDFSDLFAELNAAGARYLLVGGYAIAVHAEPRFTKDLIENKRASGRPQDLADVDPLTKHRDD